MYVNDHVDIFDMVDIDLPLTSLDEGLYALACEEDVCCLATLVRSFKLIEVYIEHGVTALDSYIRAPWFMAIIEENTDEPGRIAPIEHRSKKMLLLTWHNSSEPTNESVCESVTPRSLPERDSSTPCKDSVCESVTPGCLSIVIDDVMRQLSFEETELDGEAGFGDVAGSVVESYGLSHDESFRVNDLDLNLNEPEHIVAEVRTQEPIMEEGNGQEDESAPSSFFYDNEGIYIAYETKYDVQPSEDASTDDDDEDEDFLVHEENEIVKPDVDVHLFDVINADGFDSDPGNDDETSNYRRRRLTKLSKEVEGVINASGQWKYSFYTGYSTGPTDLNLGIEAGPSGLSSPSTKSKKKEGYSIKTLSLQKRSVSLDGAFMKGPFLGQVLAVVRLDSNNGIYPLAYALVEAESKSSWCWFLQCLGNDIDLHPNSNFTFINNRKKGIISAIKTVFPSAEHKYFLRHTHENMKQGWCGQAYKDLLWSSASSTSVKEFEKCMLELKMMNPKAHEWLNKIPPEHWARSYFSGRLV
ncbi:retrotransposon-related protein [Tanacetum coccineum]